MQDYKLTSLEYEIAVRWMEDHWTAEDRRKFARNYPQIYAKIAGCRVVVDTDRGQPELYHEPVTKG